MEQPAFELIPPPNVVRDRLAENYEQARLLRRLLKLSEDASIERFERDSENRTPPWARGWHNETSRSWSEKAPQPGRAGGP